MHAYRTHTCADLRADHVDQTVRLSGWVHRKRDHGNLLFVDLRDHYGLTQCVLDISSPIFATFETLRPESVISVTGRVVKLERVVGGAGMGLRWGAQQLAKLVPGAGSLVGAGVAGAGTLAIGRSAMAYFIDGPGSLREQRPQLSAG